MSLITADLNGKNHVLGKGKLFFDRFANGVSIVAATEGEGERYLGGTPSFTFTSASEKLDHFDSDTGLKVKDDTVQLSVNRSGKFASDNMVSENFALMVLGDAATLAQTAQTAQVSVIVAAKKGRFYQIGKSLSLPQGVRKISNVVVKKGVAFGTTVTATGNFEIDSDLARIYIETTAPDIDGVDIQVTYDTAASTRETVVSSSKTISGALRFIADNPKGANRDFYFPYVTLQPDGDFALKGDTWQEASFTVEILKKADNIEAVYIDGRAS